MNKIWPRVTKENPCPICGKGDWCQVGDRSVKCMRVESTHACSSGGWYHVVEGLKPILFKKAKDALCNINFGRMIREWVKSTSLSQINTLAKDLGVFTESLLALEACWTTLHMAWAFPMKDGYGETIGIRLRNQSGKKWAVTGSRQGIFIPKSVLCFGPVYICEGPTDTSAALSMGLYAVGRPSCNSGVEQIKTHLQNIKAKRVVIVADNDEPKSSGLMPGIDGAKKLKKDLPYWSVIYTPPTKDIRSFYNQGGNRTIIEADLRNKIWKRG